MARPPRGRPAGRWPVRPFARSAGRPAGRPTAVSTRTGAIGIEVDGRRATTAAERGLCRRLTSSDGRRTIQGTSEPAGIRPRSSRRTCTPVKRTAAPLGSESEKGKSPGSPPDEHPSPPADDRALELRLAISSLVELTMGTAPPCEEWTLPKDGS